MAGFSLDINRISHQNYYSDLSGYNVGVYKGFYSSYQELLKAVDTNPSIDISDVWMTGNEIDAGYKFDKSTTTFPFTIVLTRQDGKLVLLKKIELVIYYDMSSEYDSYVSVSSLAVPDKTYYDEWRSIGYGSYRYENDIETCTFRLEPEYSLDDDYYIFFTYYDKETDNRDSAKVSKAVVGLYDTLSAANSQPDIKTSLFDENIRYKGDFSGNGISFTVFGTDGSVHKLCIKTEASPIIPNPGSSDTYFYINGVLDKNNSSYNDKIYILPYEHDSYYANGFQTVFVNDSDIDLTQIKPTFYTGEKVTAFQNGIKQESGITIKDFSAGSLQYSAAAEDGRNLRNYQISIIKKQSGASLYVNAIKDNKREVMFNSIYGYEHDIFIANIGDQLLTGVNVELENAVNVKLDDYWRVGGANNNTIAAFTSTEVHSFYSELDNVAKIRLLPDGEGEIHGTLKITTANGGERSIILEGKAGNPKITTKSDDVVHGVKYVPYSYLIQTDNMYPWNDQEFMLLSNGQEGQQRLPKGMTLKPNGELYGVPTETGEFTFDVYVYFDYSPSAYATFTLKINDNTDEYVNAATDEDYTILESIPKMSSYTNQTFKVDNIDNTSFESFMGFWLDGNLLKEDADYTKDKGSTVIVVRSQTFEKYGEGTHTIAAEFRVDGDENKELKRAAQNYTLDLSAKNNTSATVPNSGRSSSYSGRSVAASTTSKTTDTTADTTNNSGADNNDDNSDSENISGNVSPVDNADDDRDNSSPKVVDDISDDPSDFTGESYKAVSDGRLIGGNESVLAYINKPLVIRIDAPFEDFVALKLNGVELERDVDYTAEEGSTVLTIAPQTLQKYENGEYKLTAVFKDRQVEINVLISDKQSNENPHTGVDYLISFALVSALILAAALLCGKHKFNKSI